MNQKPEANYWPILIVIAIVIVAGYFLYQQQSNAALAAQCQNAGNQFYQQQKSLVQQNYTQVSNLLSAAPFSKPQMTYDITDDYYAYSGKLRGCAYLEDDSFTNGPSGATEAYRLYNITHGDNPIASYYISSPTSTPSQDFCNAFNDAFPDASAHSELSSVVAMCKYASPTP